MYNIEFNRKSMQIVINLYHIFFFYLHQSQNDSAPIKPRNFETTEISVLQNIAF